MAATALYGFSSIACAAKPLQVSAFGNDRLAHDVVAAPLCAAALIVAFPGQAGAGSAPG